MTARKSKSATKPRATRDDEKRADAALGSKNPELTSWWAAHVVSKVDHDVILDEIYSDSGLSAHFIFMTLMSAGIAILGLLLSSPAVVIGAMLISPLMGPIIGVGFALATFDTDHLRHSVWAVLVGTVIAVLFCAIIALASPLQTVTAEIASRTRPNLFDLVVALLSGLAATYAMVRGRHGAIVGVAIATALMPPIAVMGFGLATANWQVLSGSSLLFFTNFMTIAAATAVLARLYGFATELSPNQTRLQASLLVVTLIALAVPLGFALRNIAWEALASRDAKSTIADAFGDGAHVTDVQLDFDRRPIAISATVLTPNYVTGAESRVEKRLAEQLGKSVNLSIDQVRTADGDADAVEIANAKAASIDRSATRIAVQLAAVAGVDAERVLIDRRRKVAEVRAKPLPGASLVTYREIENRIRAAEPGWSILLVPPLLDLPGLDEDRDGAIATAGWASTRTNAALVVSGEDAEAIAEQLRKEGAQATVSGTSGRNRIDWAD